jgi:hypothetical protein
MKAVIVATANDVVLTSTQMPKYTYYNDGNEVLIPVDQLSVKQVYWSGTWDVLSVTANSVALTGNVSITANTNAIAGVGTKFDDELDSGDIFKVESECFVVDTISSNTALTVVSKSTVGHTNKHLYKCDSVLEFRLSGSSFWLLEACPISLLGTDGVKLNLTGNGSIVMHLGKN